MHRRVTACTLAFALVPFFASAADLRFVQGDWFMESVPPGCEERLTLTPDGIVRVVSGEERLEGTYLVEELAGTESVVRFIRSITKVNHRRDCAGRRTDEKGVTRVGYLLKDGDTAIRLCLDAQGLKCLATYKRAKTAASP